MKTKLEFENRINIDFKLESTQLNSTQFVLIGTHTPKQYAMENTFDKEKLFGAIA